MSDTHLQGTTPNVGPLKSRDGKTATSSHAEFRWSDSIFLGKATPRVGTARFLRRFQSAGPNTLTASASEDLPHRSGRPGCPRTFAMTIPTSSHRPAWLPTLGRAGVPGRPGAAACACGQALLARRGRAAGRPRGPRRRRDGHPRRRRGGRRTGTGSWCARPTRAWRAWPGSPTTLARAAGRLDEPAEAALDPVQPARRRRRRDGPDLLRPGAGREAAGRRAWARPPRRSPAATPARPSR